MMLKKLYIGAFGKLKDKAVDLKPGLNVIYGENGSGKSTLMQFIKAVFYGFDRKERSSAIPWDGGGLSGFVTYDADGKELMTSCKFGKTARGDSVTTIDNLNGDEISTDFVGRSVFDMGGVSFSKTAFISSGSAIDSKGDDEIAEKLSNLKTTGDEAVSFAAADSDIDSFLAKLIAKRGQNGRIQQLEASIEEIKAEISSAYLKLEGAESTKRNLDDAYKRKAELEKNIDFYKSSVEAEKFFQLKSIKDAIDRIGDIPDLSEAYALAKNIRQIKSEVQSLKASLDGMKCDYFEGIPISEEDFNAAAESFYKRKSRNPVFILSVILAVGFAVLGFFNPYFFIGTALMSALAVVKRPRSAGKSEILEKYGFSDFESFKAGYLKQEAEKQVSEKLENERKQAQKAFDDAVSRLEAEKNRAEALFNTSADDELQKMYEKAEKDKAEKAAYEKSYSALIKDNDYNELEKLYGGIEPKPDSSLRLAHSERELREVNDNISALERRAGSYEGSPEPCELERRRDELSEKLLKLRSDYSCLEIVKETLNDAYEVMEGEFGAKLNDKAGEILKDITTDYSSVRMNRNYGVKLSEGSEMHDAQEFSNGLFEQIYLSFRLAILSLMDCPSPVFLDDALMTYDDKRAKNTIEYLNSCGRQVLLFTCRRRDAELAKDTGANIIEI